MALAILIDCLHKCNAMHLTRDEYQKTLDEMLTARGVRPVSLELILSAIGD
jgi:hypothetical protein